MSIEILKALAKHLNKNIDGMPKFVQYWDEGRKSRVDVMEVADAPSPGFTTVATLGLSDASIGLVLNDKHLRTELLMVLRTNQAIGANVVSSCAFNVINSGMKIRPGVIYSRVVEAYRPTSKMKHVLFTAPFLWDIETQEFEDVSVAWLQAVPISDSEYDYAEKRGSEALEDLLEEHDADVYNLDREAVV